jgi:NAD+ synthase (glutamine-hydrolysing)
MNGGLAPIGDLFKTDVVALCHRINEKSRLQSGDNIIPETILTKPPSAELRPNQTDQDSLPPYDLLDAVLKEYFSGNHSPNVIAETLGVKVELTIHIVQTMTAMEFKRRQSPPSLKIP